jgi:hypothetical protein
MIHDICSCCHVARHPGKAQTARASLAVELRLGNAICLSSSLMSRFHFLHSFAPVYDYHGMICAMCLTISVHTSIRTNAPWFTSAPPARVTFARNAPRVNTALSPRRTMDYDQIEAVDPAEQDRKRRQHQCIRTMPPEGQNRRGA